VAGRDEELVLLIVGAGDGSPLQELARALGIGDRVRVLPRREDAAALFAAMDVFVHPALAESFGMVIVEAMAMGKPIVSTAVGIAPDVLEDSAIGVLAPDGRVESLRAALSEVLARRPEWETMGAEAHRRSKRFSAERMVDEYESYYLRMLGAARRGGQPHA